jgi:hypothetical protein
MDDSMGAHGEPTSTVPPYVTLCPVCKIADAEVTFSTWDRRASRVSVLYVLECSCGWADARRVTIKGDPEPTDQQMGEGAASA